MKARAGGNPLFEAGREIEVAQPVPRQHRNPNNPKQVSPESRFADSLQTASTLFYTILSFAMSSTAQSPSMSEFAGSPLTTEQAIAWLRGLFTIAWSDGQFEPEEQDVIHSLINSHFQGSMEMGDLTTIAGPELAQELGPDPVMAENFLRTAVMVAIADGVYSSHEDRLLFEYAQALHLQDDVLQSLRSTLYVPNDTESSGQDQHNPEALLDSSMHSTSDFKAKPDVLNPVKDWLDGLAIHDPRVAHFLCRMIPPQCPFERDVALFGHKIVHIPPLCKLNPLYDQLVFLRFRAISYLADDCKEDVSNYC